MKSAFYSSSVFRPVLSVSAGLIVSQVAGMAQSALDQLDTLVVTGSQFLEPLKEAPVRTEIYDEEFIRFSNVRNFAELVESSPGVRLDSTCGNCNTQQIQMLGLSQQYVGILNDGLPNFTGLAGVYGIEQIPAGLIGGIEVVKGGGSVLYGPNAVAGVINLLPRDPVKSGSEVRLQVGTFTEGDSFGKGPSYSGLLMHDYVSDDERLKFTAYYSEDYVMPVDLNGDGFTNISERYLRAGGFRTAWRPVEGQLISFDYLHTDEERRGGDAGSAFDAYPDTNVIAEELFSTRQVATLKWEGALGKDWSASAAYSFSRTERDSYYGGLAAFNAPDGIGLVGRPFWNAGRSTGETGYGETSSDLHFVNLLSHYQLNERHRFTFGAQYRYELVEDTSATGVEAIDDSFSDLGILAQHRYKAGDQWTFEYGARLDFHSNLSDPVFSPRGSVLYTHNDAVRVRGAVSTGFRAPEIFDEDLHINLVGGDIQAIRNSPDLVEEQSTTFSISPEWQIDDHWRLEGSAFYTRLQDTFVIGGPDSGGPGVQLRDNGGDSDIYGLELNLGYFQDNWDLQFSWVEQRLEYEDPFEVFEADGGIAAIDTGRYVRTPNSMGQLRFTHRGEWFDTFLTCRLTGPMDVPRQQFDSSNGDLVSQSLERSDWFVNLDIGLRKTIPLEGGQTLTLNAGVRNLLNEFQDDLDEGAFRDPNYIYGPVFPRSVYFGVGLEF